MLKNCPECKHSVSESAFSCPNCGFPFSQLSHKSASKKRARRRRLPNGFGQISEIKGRNLRKPFRVMITVGKDDFGAPICKLLEPTAYFATYNEAYQALIKYHEDPYATKAGMTVEELYNEWLNQTDVSPKRLGAYHSWWTYCEPIKFMSISEIRQPHINALISNPTKIKNNFLVTATPITKKRILEFLKMMFRYAESQGYIQRDYVSKVIFPKNITSEITESASHHISFSDSEMRTIWELSAASDVAKIILIQCYSGWRPSELLSLKLTDIYDGAMHGGMKTKSGKNRIVPIHSKIKDFLNYFIDRAKSKDSDAIFINSSNNRAISYRNYNYIFSIFVRSNGLNLNHKPHDARKQFITMCKNAGVDEYAIKRMVGHSITDITESVYTDRPLSWLKTEIEKI